VDWAHIQANSITGKKLTALSDLSAVLILNLSGFYRPRHRWNVAGEKPNDAEWNDIEHAISQMEDEIMQAAIGLVIPHVLADTTNLSVLDCDGSTYLREDYPNLYAVISPDLIIDADSFRVPNLNGRFPRGKDTGETVGFEGGEKEHVLSVGEMPSHSHSNPPHNHTEIIAVPSVAGVGVDVPVPSATPSAGATGFASITIDASGGGDAHNNEPQYTILKWLIVAG